MVYKTKEFGAQKSAQASLAKGWLCHVFLGMFLCKQYQVYQVALYLTECTFTMQLNRRNINNFIGLKHPPCFWKLSMLLV